MHAQQKMPIATPVSPAPAGARNGHAMLVSPLSDIAGKYALLLKYSDKARAAELHMSSFPDDLRESFRREAVANPARIPEIAARLAAEERKRSSRFGDPKLDALYRKLGSWGPDAQSEFQQVVELLKGEVDPEQVFDQIVGRMDRRSCKREAASVVQLIETPQALEQRRRRAEEIAGEIENLRRVSESRYLAAEPEAPQKAGLPHTSVANSNCRGEAVERTESAGEAPTVPVVAVPAMPQLPPRMLPGTRLSVRPPHWAAAAAVASVVVAVMSCVGFGLMVPPTGAADLAHRPAVADEPRQAMQQEATVNVAAIRAAETRTAELRAAEEIARAEAALRREEETRLAKVEEEKAQVEAAQQIAKAEAETGLAAQEAEQRQAAESRPTPEAAEAGLNLSERDHKRVQVALTALGHQTPATGYFGPITRAMIADWQKTQGLPSSGFLDASQLATLSAKTASAEAEAGLTLSERDHKRVQLALTALGHQTPATGYFGPITRAMIADWQRTQGLPSSGFLDAAQLAALYAKTEPAEAEADLNLSELDHKRAQLALTALGHQTPATGYFGPITRAMIADWQRTQGLPSSGFLDSAQLAALYAQTVPSLPVYDQRKSQEPREGL